MKRPSVLLALIAVLAPALPLAHSAEEEVDIIKFGSGRKSIPLFVGGYTGEAATTLRFDLASVPLGCEPVPTGSYQLIARRGSKQSKKSGRKR